MADLVVWLHAQLNEDERIARAAPPGPWVGTDAEDVGAWSVYDGEWLIASATVYAHDRPMGGKRGPGYINAAATTEHIAEWDPARVLREIDAKRQLVKLHGRATLRAGGLEQYFATATVCRSCEPNHQFPEMSWPCPTLRLLALPYTDRPGYRDDWRP